MPRTIPPRAAALSAPWRGAAPILTIALVACGGDSPLGPGRIVLSTVYASQDFTCALGESGAALCWGVNDAGQLGAGAGFYSSSPHVVSEELRFRQVSTKPAARHVCGVTTSGDAYCWGRNDFGQIGKPSTQPGVGPQLVPGGLTFASVSAGWRSSCGITTDGDAYCWGRGEWGQLGDGLATGSSVPVAVAGGHKFRKVEVGHNNLVCGLTNEGRILCWGLDLAGSLGSQGSDTCTRSDGLQLACAKTPQGIAANELFVDVSTGFSFACGIARSYEVICWGRNDVGQLGRATTEVCAQGTISGIPCGRSPSPISAGPTLVSVAAGSHHVCGVTEAGHAHCWGRDTFGQLGTGGLGTNITTATPVRGSVTFRTVSAGNEHTCGEGTDGALYCWGKNQWGQLGTGDLRLWLEPTRVVDAP